MPRVAGPFKSSVNAGQISKSLWGKVNLKQYYSAAKEMTGVEAVPQSGFSLMPGTLYTGAGVSGACRHTTLTVSSGLSYTLIFTVGQADIWRNDGVKVATVAIAAITADLLPELEFYGEANTVGVFHQDLWNGIKLFRDKTDDTNWTVDVWPYDLLPNVDLGGTYAQEDDIWDLFFKWSGTLDDIQATFTLESETTDVVALGVSTGSDTATSWTNFAAAIETELSAIPGFSSGVTVDYIGFTGSSAHLTVTFGGALTGAEYAFYASIVNTSSASVLATHTQAGNTAGEPLISSTQGGFSAMMIFQDRAIYTAPKARPASFAMSRSGEYFDLNIKTQADNGARLEALRTEISETVLYVIDATYMVAFTDRAEYFASNRTIEAGKPLNWVRASEIGTRKGCKPVVMGGYVYFVSADGGVLYRSDYDAVSEKFTPTPVNDLNNDFVTDVAQMVLQRKNRFMTAERLWIRKDDGTLLCCAANVNQEIPLAAAKWPVAGNGTVEGMSVDGNGVVWLTVNRGGTYTIEQLAEQEETLFQKTISATSDLAGQIAGLSALEGQTVWAEIANDIHGPFTVTSGAIQTDVPSTAAKVGIWAPPVYESTPFVKLLQNDDVVRRPGKVVWVRLYLSDTASIAVGANGRAAKDQALTRVSDNLDAAKKNFTGHLLVAALIGATMDPTVTITQVRPGRLNVRDYVVGAKL
ncbi:hypothetical protein [Rhizobium sp. PAMB 3182]